MADGGNREFLDALQLRVRVLEVENARLNAEILSLLEKLEICIEKYGPKCFVRKSKQVVSVPIPLFMRMILVDFSTIA
jgi:hypothetical protein